jgi:hypothetical protein
MAEFMKIERLEMIAPAGAHTRIGMVGDAREIETQSFDEGTSLALIKVSKFT